MTLIRRSNNGFPNLFEDIFGKDFFDNMPSAMPGTIPAVNIKEHEDGFEVEVAAPGMKKGDFKIELNDNVLSISSEKESSKEEKDGKGRYTRREFSVQSFSRSFTLPDIANVEKIGANYEDGVLHIHIPKKDEAKVKPNRLISIK